MTTLDGRIPVRNGQAVPLDTLAELSPADFRDRVVAAAAAGERLACLTAGPADDDGTYRLLAVLADDAGQTLSIAATRVGASYPALTPDCTQAHLFEREILESRGIVPEGHPWPKPVRHPTRRLDGTAVADWTVPGAIETWTLKGDDVHEVAVGPVHAGVIEPGHFRFQCHGEDVLHLEIALGFQHRGVERALVGGPGPRTFAILETLAGDTTIGHATAGAQVVEGLAGIEPTARAHRIRALALELERLANHTGDLGALAGDVGFLPTSAWCGRLRGDWLNLSALACGSRFGRGLVRPGGVRFDLDAARCQDAATRVRTTMKDVEGAIELLLGTHSVLARFETTGVVSPEDAVALGLVGPCARACGLPHDVRQDHPTGAWTDDGCRSVVEHGGDVAARARVRWREVKDSVARCLAWLDELAGTPTEPVVRGSPAPSLAPRSLVVSLVEGWRGEVLHLATTDAAGRIDAWKVVDPSFRDWQGLSLALRNERISDFPLCNKSFNLSYCGFDL